MNCPEVKERLSAFYDAELPTGELSPIADHIAGCSQCARELLGFEKLTDVVRRLDAPAAAPDQIWRRIQEQLDGMPPIERTARKGLPLRPAWSRLHGLRPTFAVAAVLLIAVGWLAYSTWVAPTSRNLLAANFEAYVAQFSNDPDAAQQILLTKFDGREIELTDAVRHVGYRPAIADGMPAEYEFDSAYVLRMPCCDCLQTICQRSDGSKIAIFEYADEQPVSFGDLPESVARCQGKDCRLVEINEQFAVNWKRGGRHISVVGVRDQPEMESLVAWLD